MHQNFVTQVAPKWKIVLECLPVEGTNDRMQAGYGLKAQEFGCLKFSYHSLPSAQ